LHTISSTIHDFLDYSAVKSIVLAVNLCICLSYPLNFGIYCGMSRQFRETFKELFIQRVTGGGHLQADGMTRANSHSKRQVQHFLNVSFYVTFTSVSDQHCCIWDDSFYVTEIDIVKT
jgi:hypothetical protein